MIEFNFTNAKNTNSDLSKLKTAREQLLKREDIGFFKTPERDHLWSTSQARADEIAKKNDELVIVGIGGSALGTKAIKGFFTDKEKSSAVHVWDSLDPLVLEAAWKQIRDPGKTHFVIISKSGSTLETFATAQWIGERLNQAGYDLSQRSTVITEKTQNTLSNWAAQNSIVTLEVPLDVGGRFTVLTPVSLVAAAFMGLQLEELRAGAKLAIKDEEFLLKLSQETLASFERGEFITLLWYYSDFMADLGRWTQQLWAESLAKKTDRAGQPGPRVSTPVVALGPADQHSLLQQIMEGHRDKWVWVVEFPEYSTEAFTSDLFQSRYELKGLHLDQIHKIQSKSIRQALDQSGVSTLGLRFKERSERSLGYYFMCLELLIGTLGEALNINAFDQPGVELGKVIARDFLKNRTK